MGYDDNDIEWLIKNLRWNLTHKKILCVVGPIPIGHVGSALLKLLSIEMDSVKRETVNLVHELYDATEIFSGVDPHDEADVKVREHLYGFLTAGD